MRRSPRVLVAVLAVAHGASVAAAGPWSVTLEGGAEADTNVQRVETGPGLMTERIGAGVARLGGRIGRRDKALGGAYAMIASALTRLVASDVATSENVTLLSGELRYLRPVEDRSLSLGVGAIAADAQPLTDTIGARTFRNLGADALLVLDGGERKQLTVAFGARSFVYKENREFDWVGPVASARLDLTLWQPAGGTRSLNLAAFVAFEARDYDATALADACPPDAEPDDTCSAGTSLPRRDRVQRIGVELTSVGRTVATAGYQLVVIESNSYGQSLVRHRATVSATRALPLGLYGTALGILQIDQFPDGLVLKTDIQRREFTSLDDENRSSIQIRIARPVSSAWSLETRAAIWRNIGGDTETAFRRASLYAGAVYAVDRPLRVAGVAALTVATAGSADGRLQGAFSVERCLIALDPRSDHGRELSASTGGEPVRQLAFACAAVVVAVGCSNLELDPPAGLIHARFDPDARVIPMPTDVLRDPDAERLDLPNDTPEELDKLTAAEAEFYTYLETLDGWSTLMSATVEFTGAIDPRSVTDGTVQVWRRPRSAMDAWQRVTDVRLSVSADGKQLTINPPRTGWERGDRYVAVARGGANGIVGLAGERVECDAAFYFLRQTTPLDTPAHERAFPGATAEERRDNARRLEEIRLDLAPAFAMFDTAQGAARIPRGEVAALWSFTVTTRTELAMDQPSQRIPLPIDLMLDPATGHVHAPVAPWDTEVEAEAKERLAAFDGFSLSGGQLFEFTQPMSAAQLTESTVKLYQLGGAQPVHVPATVELLLDKRHLVVTPKAGRLTERTTYALVVSTDVRDEAGAPPAIMPIGHFLMSRAPLLVDGVSQVPAVDAHDAKKLELSRQKLAAALDQLPGGRDRVLAAWPFTTMSVAAPLRDLRNRAEQLGVPADPANVIHMTPGEALLDFAIGVGSILDVADVYHGTIKSPVYLDPVTRGWRGDGGHVVEDIHFTMTVPENPRPGPMPVVIFGHGLVTERRFVLAVGDALAAKGYAAISIDFPYHGNRTYCAKGGPISIVDPTDGSLASLNPCKSGTTCNDLGRCVDAQGNGNHLAKFPVIDMPVATGAVFLEIEHIANSKDHFQQALIDLGALDRSLRRGAWAPLLGRDVDTTRIFYAGQSLGGIMGAVFLGTDPDIQRAVLNVPGANLVPMFDDSTFFSPQMDAFFTRQGITRASYEGRRFISVAKWFMDAVDPMHLGPTTGDRSLLIQMATLDFIIPNDNTRLLQEVTGAPRRDYLGEHAFITIPLEPAYFRGVRELASFLSGELVP